LKSGKDQTSKTESSIQDTVTSCTTMTMHHMIGHFCYSRTSYVPVSPQLPYSPTLATANSYTSPTTETIWNGQRFRMEEEVKETVMTELMERAMMTGSQERLQHCSCTEVQWWNKAACSQICHDNG
jgi:hypothetical protein